MKSYKIHLIRHGETDSNKLGQYIGVTDVELSEQGESRLREMDGKNGYPFASVVFSSPLKRCLETVRIIYPNIEPTVIEGLSECDFGDWEGKTVDELSSDESYRKWVSGSGGRFEPPNGESMVDFQIRVCKAFEDIVERLMRSGTTDAAVVTHGGTIMAILASFGLPRANFYDWMTGNGCGYSVRVTPVLWMSGRVMEVYARLPLDRREEDEVIYAARQAAYEIIGDKRSGKEDPEDKSSDQ
ncbi:MAG: histidine phosphatase family protein [Clostridia bacterium]|nr:histidine phosphatase family protein [Clostridia bacterium]